MCKQFKWNGCDSGPAQLIQGFVLLNPLLGPHGNMITRHDCHSIADKIIASRTETRHTFPVPAICSGQFLYILMSEIELTKKVLPASNKTSILGLTNSEMCYLCFCNIVLFSWDLSSKSLFMHTPIRIDQSQNLGYIFGERPRPKPYQPGIMLDDGVVLEDNALRDRNEDYNEQYDEIKREDELSWEELTDTKTDLSLQLSEDSNYVILYNNQHNSCSTNNLVLLDSHSTTRQPSIRSNSPISSISAWEFGSIWNVRNKFVLTSQCFKLPWSLEAVIRPETPIQKSTPNSPELSNEATFFEEDESQTVSVKPNSVVAKTVRLPVALASDMLIFILKLIWPKDQNTGSSSSQAELLESPYYQVVM